MPRRPANPFRHAAPRPYAVQDNVNGYIPLRSVPRPDIEACLVPVNGNLLQAEQTAALIEMWSIQDARGKV